MEFSHLGSHCGERNCRQLDFLPLKCDACSSLFCSSHLPYESHSCPQRHTKDVQVPVCPLCNTPIPVPRGSLPDAKVWEHMDSDACGAKKKKAPSHPGSCSVRRCKNKEPIPFHCPSCSKSLCISHRHPQDHECSKETSSKPTTSKQNTQTQSQIEQDHLLALALSQEANSGTPPNRTSSSSSASNKSCRVS
eukprot:TRINITY_DN2395_c0_g1_i2.p1 TRINITY_DN2395_c0_g1~~TRINITY_DN2395_c0_g1_i2.p1  ORF type:complete len:192 (+),score=54.85 TRINITY_DN2395_c0_g1_i2:364-939(+)